MSSFEYAKTLLVVLATTARSWNPNASLTDLVHAFQENCPVKAIKNMLDEVRIVVGWTNHN
jgi:hypothetical protein